MLGARFRLWCARWPRFRYATVMNFASCQPQVVAACSRMLYDLAVVLLGRLYRVVGDLVVVAAF